MYRKNPETQSVKICSRYEFGQFEKCSFEKNLGVFASNEEELGLNSK